MADRTHITKTPIHYDMFNLINLITIYISVVRPVVEYACPVWNTNLPIYLSDNIEMIQKRAVRAIFPGMSYDDILTHINLSTLKDRRDYICKKYFINMQARSHKVNCLLPDKRHFDHDLRRGNMYPLPVTRTNRYKNSLIPWGLYHWQWLLTAHGSLMFEQDEMCEMILM